jgi:hypothetical protein
LAEHFSKECFWIHAMRGIVRAGIDAAWFLQVRAKVAGSSLLLDDRFFAAGMFGIVGHHFERMQIDVAVGTVVRAQSAADAPVLNDDFERIAPTYRSHGAANHAERIAALAATGGDEVLIESEPVANQARDAVVGIGASVHASVATRTILQIENQEALRFHQALGEKLVDGNAVNHLHALLIGGTSLSRNSFKAGSNSGEPCDHVPKIITGDSNEFDVIKRCARRGSNASAQQADFAKIIAARKISENQLASRIVL